MGFNLLVINSDNRNEWGYLVGEAVKLTTVRLYIWYQEKLGEANTNLLNCIAELLKPVANRKPRLDVVPLMPFATWSLANIANLTDLRRLMLTSNDLEKGKSLLSQLNQSRRADLPRIEAVLLPAREPASEEKPDARPDQGAHSASQVAAQPDGSLAFENVAVGGTFDRLHVGHRLLLAATALICTGRVYVGVTGDKLLENKKHHELLEPYDQRAAAAVSYLKAVRPRLTVQTGALLDPKEPTAAATEEGMQALVVSKETVSGGEAINQYRREHGFQPLELIVVDLVADSAALEGGKVSSTALREQDAAAAAERSKAA